MYFILALSIMLWQLGLCKKYHSKWRGDIFVAQCHSLEIFFSGINCAIDSIRISCGLALPVWLLLPQNVPHSSPTATADQVHWPCSGREITRSFPSTSAELTRSRFAIWSMPCGLQNTCRCMVIYRPRSWLRSDLPHIFCPAACSSLAFKSVLPRL
ncbi:hypothetical protein DFH27DRAFT_21799 [Peziza echinospora]|nr:hypothetical protein DFH27DRAFT_21799 [Peziza echinospora]